MINIADEIKRLHELHQSGALTDAEFAQAKEKVLASANEEQTHSSNSGSAGNWESAGAQSSPFTQLNHLRRSKTNQWLGGVCAGLGKFSGLEAWVWRLAFILFFMCFGFGVIAYLLAWVLIPEEA